MERRISNGQHFTIKERARRIVETGLGLLAPAIIFLLSACAPRAEQKTLFVNLVQCHDKEGNLTNTYLTNDLIRIQRDAVEINDAHAGVWTNDGELKCFKKPGDNVSDKNCIIKTVNWRVPACP
jgi:hypothetical protein